MNRKFCALKVTCIVAFLTVLKLSFLAQTDYKLATIQILVFLAACNVNDDDADYDDDCCICGVQVPIPIGAIPTSAIPTSAIQTVL